jgi:cellulose 1,4-beta-cellobiosidase
VTLLSVDTTPPDATLTAHAVSNTNGFRYVRYYSPDNSHGDIAEAQFFSSSSPSTNPGAVPSAPAGLTATPGNQQVGLSWTASLGATSYNIKRGTSSGGPYTNIATRLVTVHIDAGLPNGTYYYVVSAVDSTGESANSAESTARLTCATPVAPDGLAITAEYGRLILVWSPVASVDCYNVLRSTNRAGPYALQAASVAATSWTDSTITDRAVYYYEVQAVNSCGPGPSSIPVNASLAGLERRAAIDVPTSPKDTPPNG